MCLLTKIKHPLKQKCNVIEENAMVKFCIICRDNIISSLQMKIRFISVKIRRLFFKYPELAKKHVRTVHAPNEKEAVTLCCLHRKEVPCATWQNAQYWTDPAGGNTKTFSDVWQTCLG